MHYDSFHKALKTTFKLQVLMLMFFLMVIKYTKPYQI